MSELVLTLSGIAAIIGDDEMMMPSSALNDIFFSDSVE